MKKTDPKTPPTKYIDLVTPLPRKLASVLPQLRTGHTPLAKHLHRIGKADSPTCPACQQDDETVQHLILHCQAHQAARQKLRNSTGGRDINLMKLFTTTKTLRALFTFITETWRWHSTFGDLLMLEEEQQRRGQGEERER
jgi:zinc-binding in reverse transcriptase